MRTPEIYLVIAKGKDVGGRLRIGEAPSIVGRARDAALVVADGHVSRQHLRVHLEGEGARVRAIDEATAFVVRGAPERDAVVGVGETIILGQTVLVLTRLHAPEEGGTGERHSTELSTLMTGLAADVRGLAAAMDLIASLDAAGEEEDVRLAAAAWGRMYLGATSVRLLSGAAAEKELEVAPEDPPSVVERADVDGATLVLAAPGHTGNQLWLAFTCPMPTGPGAAGEVSDTSRRLVAVAARLCASSITRVEALQDSRRERDLFRRAALGSARAFLGDSPAAREVSKLAARLATSDVVVLLQGETGVGKTFLARLIHELGPRAKAPLRVLNCAAIPETLLESELFGHERGAFTGATASKPGALEAAGSGTVVLDEIGELPLASQAKLLRVLEERTFERLGSNETIPLAARIITATNRDLAAMAEAGTFRADLYYRIAVVRLRIPPLRDRGDDLTLLAERMLADLAPSAGRRVRGFAPATLDLMRRYPWPGNVRELRNAIERALAVGDEVEIVPGDFPETVVGAAVEQSADPSIVRLPAKLAWLEERAIEAALRATGGNQRRAALLLGINRVTLHRKRRAEDSGTREDPADDE